MPGCVSDHQRVPCCKSKGSRKLNFDTISDTITLCAANCSLYCTVLFTVKSLQKMQLNNIFLVKSVYYYYSACIFLFCAFCKALVWLALSAGDKHEVHVFFVFLTQCQND